MVALLSDGLVFWPAQPYLRTGIQLSRAFDLSLPILRCPAYLTLSPVTQANRTQTPTVKGPEPIGRLQLLL
jgi:hypothetical protein